MLSASYSQNQQKIHQNQDRIQNNRNRILKLYPATYTNYKTYNLIRFDNIEYQTNQIRNKRQAPEQFMIPKNSPKLSFILHP